MRWHAVGCAPDRRGECTPRRRGTDRRVRANRRVSGLRAARPVSPPPARSRPAALDRRRARQAAAGTDQQGRTSRRSSQRRARGRESWRTKPRPERVADSSGHGRYRRGVCPYAYRAKSFSVKAGLITTEVNVISSSTHRSPADLTMRCATLMPETFSPIAERPDDLGLLGFGRRLAAGCRKADLSLVPNPGGYTGRGVELERRRPITRTRGNNRGRIRWLEHQRHRLAGKREHAEHEARESREFRSRSARHRMSSHRWCRPRGPSRRSEAPGQRNPPATRRHPVLRRSSIYRAGILEFPEVAARSACPWTRSSLRVEPVRTTDRSEATPGAPTAATTELSAGSTAFCDGAAAMRAHAASNAGERRMDGLQTVGFLPSHTETTSLHLGSGHCRAALLRAVPGDAIRRCSGRCAQQAIVRTPGRRLEVNKQLRQPHQWHRVYRPRTLVRADEVVASWFLA